MTRSREEDAARERPPFAFQPGLLLDDLPDGAGRQPRARAEAGAPGFERERAWHARGAHAVAGVDEVGRGALAGPVVAAAVLLAPDAGGDPRLGGVRDSKQLAPAERTAAARAVRAAARAVGLGSATPAEIDGLGIAAATHLAMRRALRALGRPIDAVLVDGRPIAPLAPRQEAIVGGDARVLSIACASVVAKVVRDAWLCRADLERPGYGLGAHKGYGTRLHLEALAVRGPCAWHRRTWRPVAALARVEPEAPRA